jgi:hypothetical protein
VSIRSGRFRHAGCITRLNGPSCRQTKADANEDDQLRIPEAGFLPYGPLVSVQPSAVHRPLLWPWQAPVRAGVHDSSCGPAARIARRNGNAMRATNAECVYSSADAAIWASLPSIIDLQWGRRNCITGARWIYNISVEALVRGDRK